MVSSACSFATSIYHRRHFCTVSVVEVGKSYARERSIELLFCVNIIARRCDSHCSPADYSRPNHRTGGENQFIIGSYMIFNQQKRHPIIAEKPPTQAACSLNCDQHNAPDGQQEPSKGLQQGLKRPNEAGSPERPAPPQVRSAGERKRTPPKQSGEPATVGGQQLASSDGIQLEQHSDDEDDNEEFSFDYEPVLIRILNEKKLALSYSPDVVRFLKSSSKSQ